MAMEKKSSENKIQKQPILLALIVGCCVAIALNWHRNEINEAVEQAKTENNNGLFPYSLNEVQRVLDDQLLGWNNGNIDQFMEGYIKDSSVRFITNKKVKTSWQEITDSYKKGYPNKDAMGKLTFHRDEIRWVDKSKAIAQVIGRWEVIQKHREPASKESLNAGTQTKPNIQKKNTPTQDTLSGRFSLIFVGTPKGPKIQIDHTW